MTAAIASEIVRLDAVIRTATAAREVLKAQLLELVGPDTTVTAANGRDRVLLDRGVRTEVDMDALRALVGDAGIERLRMTKLSDIRLTVSDVGDLPVTRDVPATVRMSVRRG